ncbi:PBP1A family penicillin-binding protein [Peribacillus asahii]|uniref:PBP1A family penicillin-binding protein n=1 Tax=Peribacillus asahii TaxID=228899 RepID=UPI00381EB813
MDIFRFIFTNILSLFAQVFKIQQHWIWEVLSLLMSIVAIGLLIWGLIVLFSHKEEAITNKYKRIIYNVSFYSLVGLQIGFLVFFMGLIGISIVVIGLFILGLVALFSHKEETFINKYKRILYNVSFYSLVGLQIVLLLFFISRIGITIYIASSDSKLKDYTFDAQALQYELTNIFIYDQKGNPVYKVVHNSTNRDVVTLDEMPTQLQRAFVDVEDKQFYQHIGISIEGYVRAFFYEMIRPSQKMHGGSTITQQLIKNVNGDIYNRNVLHKFQEALLSIIIESKYSKEEILEMYLNRIYLGEGVYGVGTAARQYFNKNVYDLTLVESAYLAGLPKAPSTYTEDLKAGNQRKNIVLQAMKENETITENQYQKAVQQTIVLKQAKTTQTSALDSYVDYVLKEAKEDYDLSDKDLESNGYHIYTYLDTEFQQHMYQTAQSFSYKDDQESKDKKVQVGIAAVDNDNGNIIALYGGRDFVRGYLNRSYQYYQPGSIIKPLVVYAPALETGKWNAQSTVVDEKTNFNGYSPKNAGEKYAGKITLEQAIIRSANIPAVAVFQDIGIKTGVKVLEKMNIEIQEKDKQLHLALGGMEKGVTPIQMAQSYAVFPNYGYFKPAKAIKLIKNKNGEFVQQKEQAEIKGIDVFTSETAYHMTEMLQKVITEPNGTGKNAKIGVPVAGKTGTTEEEGTNGGIRDAWFVGYTPNVTMSVHLGFDQPSKALYLTTSGGDNPATLFARIMKKSRKNTASVAFQKPQSVKEIEERTAKEAKNTNLIQDSKKELSKIQSSIVSFFERFVQNIKTE